MQLAHGRPPTLIHGTLTAGWRAPLEAIRFLALVYLLTKVSPTEALKFCAIFNPLATLIWPWNAEFISKLGGKPMHKLPTIVFPLLSLAGLLAL